MRARSRLVGLLTAVAVAAGIAIAGPAGSAAAGSLSISGTTGLSGSTAPVADITVYYMTYDQEKSAERSVQPDALGKFVIGGLDPGRYYLFFDYTGSEGYLDEWYSNYPNAYITLASTSLNISWWKLSLPGAAAGTVSLGTSARIAAAGEVLVSYRSNLVTGKDWVSSYWSPESEPVPVDADGKFVLSNLPPGQYKLHFTYVGSDFQSAWSTLGDVTYFYSDSSGLSINSGSTRGVNRTLKAPVTISGVVRLGTSALSTLAGAGDVEVRLEFYDQRSYGYFPVPGPNLLTGADGTFSRSGLPTSAYRVVFTYVGEPDKFATVSQRIEAASTGMSALLPPLHKVTGRVLFGPTGTPAAAGEVTVSVSNGSTNGDYSTTTDSDGNYSLVGLPTATYRLVYHYNGDLDFPDVSTAAANCANCTFTLYADRLNPDRVLAPGNWVRGQVTDGLGAPIAGATVVIGGTRDVAVNYNSYLRMETTTDADGRYSIKNVPDAMVTITFSGPGLGEQVWPGVAPSTATPLHLTAGTTTHTFDAAMTDAASLFAGFDGGRLTGTSQYPYLTTIVLYRYDEVLGDWVEAVSSWGGTDETAWRSLFPGDYAVVVVYDGPLGLKVRQSPTYTLEPGSSETFIAQLKLPSLYRDVTDDLAPDVVGQNAAGDFILWAGNRTGGFVGTRNLGGIWNSANSVIATEDLAGGGVGDILTRNPAGSLFAHEVVGGGITVGYEIGTGWNRYSLLSSPGDLDGDGRVDLIGRDSSGALCLFSGEYDFNSGMPGFGECQVLSTGWGGYTAIFSPGDFDNDGTIDIVARTKSGSLMLFPGRGIDGPRKGIPMGSGWGSFTALWSPGDFNNDGQEDIFARDAAGTLWLYRGNGKGGFLGRTQLPGNWNGYKFAI